MPHAHIRHRSFLHRSLFCLMALILTGTPLLVPFALAQDETITGQPVSNMNVRTDPGEQFEISAVLPRGTPVTIEGRNRTGNWVKLHTADGSINGWVATRFIRFDQRDLELWMIPVVGEQPATTSGEFALATVEEREYYIPGSYIELESLLQSQPVLPATTARAVSIFNQGQALGNNADVFMKVGDCHTDHQGFMRPIGAGRYALGDYAYLQDTITFFAHPVPNGELNSFINLSEAAEGGFITGTVIDGAWSDPAFCHPGEAPLLCEYRQNRPAFAVIQFGAADMQVYTPYWFDRDLRIIVETLAQQGVVPVLTTFAVRYGYREYERALQLNAVIVKVGQDLDVPVINFWAGIQDLPERGVIDDDYHLTDDWGFIVGKEGEVPFLDLTTVQSGMSLLNLLVLQTLDQLRHDLVG